MVVSVYRSGLHSGPFKILQRFGDFCFLCCVYDHRRLGELAPYSCHDYRCEGLDSRLCFSKGVAHGEGVYIPPLCPPDSELLTRLGCKWKQTSLLLYSSFPRAAYGLHSNPESPGALPLSCLTPSPCAPNLPPPWGLWGGVALGNVGQAYTVPSIHTSVPREFFPRPLCLCMAPRHCQTVRHAPPQM